LSYYSTIIIGAGAAGLIAAGRACEAGGSVLVLEKMKQPGRKLLITGKGRCNITNIAPVQEYFRNIYPNGRFLKHAFSAFFTNDIISLLHSYGVNTVVERGGRVFPESNLSVDVLGALLRYASERGAEFRYGYRVEKLIINDGRVTGAEAQHNGRRVTFHSGKVIVCTGGCSYPATGSTGDGYRLAEQAGHSIVPVRPALVPLETMGEVAGMLQGLSLKNCNAVVWVNGKKSAEEFGEMLFTHFGLSGPVILTLSRMVVDELTKQSTVEISVDLKPALDEMTLDRRLLRDLNEQGKKQIDHIFKLWLPAKMIPVFLHLTHIDGKKQGHQLKSEERRRILLLMKDLRFRVSGYRSFKEAVITAGGVSTAEIDSKTMESKLVRNLFFAGEVMDVDGVTGGYNLQIAFSTGWLAGGGDPVIFSSPSSLTTVR